RAASEHGDEFVRRPKGAFLRCGGTMASTTSSLLVGSPRTYISVVVRVACLNTCHWLLSPDDTTERGPRRWMSIMLMGSNAQGKRDRTMQNAVIPDAPSIAHSPLRILPIRQVMGVAHYVPQPPLPQMSGGSGAAMARRARSRTLAGPLLPCRVHSAGGDPRFAFPVRLFRVSKRGSRSSRRTNAERPVSERRA